MMEELLALKSPAPATISSLLLIITHCRYGAWFPCTLGPVSVSYYLFCKRKGNVMFRFPWEWKRLANDISPSLYSTQFCIKRLVVRDYAFWSFEHPQKLSILLLRRVFFCVFMGKTSTYKIRHFVHFRGSLISERFFTLQKVSHL